MLSGAHFVSVENQLRHIFGARKGSLGLRRRASFVLCKNKPRNIVWGSLGLTKKKMLVYRKKLCCTLLDGVRQVYAISFRLNPRRSQCLTEELKYSNRKVDGSNQCLVRVESISAIIIQSQSMFSQASIRTQFGYT